jgi:prepilin-type N-terminal cleavage/methylation domain-containing protein/prepilin-type processing-associated H-X9-DG protein
MNLRRPRVSGFTLVELLVVIAIIGVLVALLLPAVQAARESARRAQCVNHLKQMSLGFLNHESALKILPCSGWNSWYLGDPQLGTGRNQPGGWMYQILPYVEQQAVYKITDDGNPAITTAQRQASITLQQTLISFFNCPSRRPVTLRSYLLPNKWTPINGDRSVQVARGDYAANAGDSPCVIYQWRNELGECKDLDQSFYGYDYTNMRSHEWPPLHGHSGVNYLGAEIKFKDVTDGASNTYLIGEKYLNADMYEAPNSDPDNDGGDNHSVYQGYDYDINRWTANGKGSGGTSVSDVPLQDRPRQENYRVFGSAHAGGVNMAYCDGSVQSVSYDVDPEVHRVAGNRHDN